MEYLTLSFFIKLTLLFYLNECSLCFHAVLNGGTTVVSDDGFDESGTIPEIFYL